LKQLAFRKGNSGLISTLFFATLFLLFFADPAHAYIGPGAGFALLSSLFALLASFLLAFFSMLALPFRLIFGLRRRRKIYSKALVRRVVILGFDGLDPELCQQYLAGGKLPNIARLRKKGCFKKLATTFPALSPVAWSTFAYWTICELEPQSVQFFLFFYHLTWLIHEFPFQSKKFNIVMPE